MPALPYYSNNLLTIRSEKDHIEAFHICKIGLTPEIRYITLHQDRAEVWEIVSNYPGNMGKSAINGL